MLTIVRILPNMAVFSEKCSVAFSTLFSFSWAKY